MGAGALAIRVSRGWAAGPGGRWTGGGAAGGAAAEGGRAAVGERGGEGAGAAAASLPPSAGVPCGAGGGRGAGLGPVPFPCPSALLLPSRQLPLLWERRRLIKAVPAFFFFFPFKKIF